MAEAAGILGGAEAFWEANEWLFYHRGKFDDEQLRAAAANWGVSPSELLATMESPKSPL